MSGKCQWKENKGCSRNATRWAEQGQPWLCKQHRDILYKRKEKAMIATLGGREFQGLALGDVVRLYWSEGGCKHYFAEVKDVLTKHAEAVILDTLEMPGDDTPVYRVLCYLPDSEPPDGTKIRLLPTGRIVFPNLPTGATTRMTGHWGAWDDQPVQHIINY
jgi:hypothetical protein